MGDQESDGCAMWSVKMSIPSDKFFDAMQDVSGWLAEENIDTSNFSYARDAAGAVKFCIRFGSEHDAGQFARRFAGSVISSDCVRH